MAMWTLAYFFVLGRSAPTAAAAGGAAGTAILIRPNLAPLAVPLGIWLVVRRDVPGPILRARLLPAAGTTSLDLRC